MSNQSRKIFYRYAFYFSNGACSTPLMVTKHYHISHLSAYQEAVESRPDPAFYSLTLWVLDSSDNVTAPIEFPHFTFDSRDR